MIFHEIYLVKSWSSLVCVDSIVIRDIKTRLLGWGTGMRIRFQMESSSWMVYLSLFLFVVSYRINVLHPSLPFLAHRGGAASVKTLQRDLNKAFLGFSCDTKGQRIVTGNWGCGAFRGSYTINSIIQFMAAAVGNHFLSSVHIVMIYLFYSGQEVGLFDFWSSSSSRPWRLLRETHRGEVHGRGGV